MSNPLNLRQLTALLHMHSQDQLDGSARTYPGAAHTYLSLVRRGFAAYTHDIGFTLTTRGRSFSDGLARMIGEEE